MISFSSNSPDKSSINSCYRDTTCFENFNNFSPLLVKTGRLDRVITINLTWSSSWWSLGVYEQTN